MVEDSKVTDTSNPDMNQVIISVTCVTKVNVRSFMGVQNVVQTVKSDKCVNCLEQLTVKSLSQGLAN